MTQRPTPLTRCGDDGGAVVVEFAFVLPWLMLFVLAIFEFGYQYRQDTALTSITQVGARSAANLGSNRAADQSALSGIAASLPSVKSFSLDKIVIYQATAADGSLPGGCAGVAPSAAGAGINGQCNVYNQTQATAAANNTANLNSACNGSSGSSWDHFWCPSDRVDNLFSSPSQLGVYIQGTFTSPTKLFGSTKTLTDWAVYRLEPQS